MKLSVKDRQQFQSKILTWYDAHKRDLPWRKTRDPYKILVSEVMLQQTQVSRVIPKYESWLEIFPTVETLATASVSDVLRLWMGLGYNRRALYLKKTAEAVSERGAWPETETELMRLPGLGKYTANALLCFAFGKQVAVVDTNVKKVIIHEILNGKFVPEKELEKIAAEVMPEGRAYDWNQALMDYAQAVLKDKKIPLPKQSTYLGSDRYYRSKIVKLLLERKDVKRDELGYLLREDFSHEFEAWLTLILHKMEKDGLLLQEEKKIRLVS